MPRQSTDLWPSHAKAQIYGPALIMIILIWDMVPLCMDGAGVRGSFLKYNTRRLSYPPTGQVFYLIGRKATHKVQQIIPRNMIKQI
jgi:hypothetical protein